ncbi:MAG: 2-oxoglutarate dehydrogenase complex dihydrolipoyllysine-residue succinyltransferase [Alphaproteobacteria bacterium]|nr:MAG: 2-oxoglutarate dehydrogenase complex dihydrolipoyllysine-residue succinyltransferase [Alphaproteobacteria bacterium]
MTEKVTVPNLGESITEATIGNWFKEAGDQVALDEPIAELETDKVAMEVNAPVAGILKVLLAKEGETVEVGAVIAEIEPGEAKPEAAPEREEKKPEAAKAPTEEKILSPSAKKLSKELDVDISAVTGTGKDGRVGKEDIMKAVSGEPELKPVPVGEREERVRMTRMRKRIAERLKEAQNTAAILTTFNEVDMTAVIEARNRNKELFVKKHGVRLGFMSFFTKACIHALKEIPSVNAEIDGDEIVYKNHYDIGVAISIPGGLVVPVLRDADQKSFAGIEKAIFEMGTKVRDGKLSIEEMQGGTFTISNGGVFGSMLSTPILNPPQSAILGMHKIEQRPVVVDGEIVIRPMMYLALSYDHRLIDGREAVTFLVRVKELLEDTDKLLLDL